MLLVNCVVQIAYPTEYAPETSKITGLKLNSKSFNLKKIKGKMLCG
jgi:hypothetical protein